MSKSVRVSAVVNERELLENDDMMPKESEQTMEIESDEISVDG